jgi:colicin import membrane protein
VRIRLDPAGRVLDCAIENSSGRPDFDASAVNAVLRAGPLPEPPSPAQQELIISFNSRELAGN